MNDDLISRQEEVKSLEEWESKYTWDSWAYNYKDDLTCHIESPSSVIKELSSIEPEIVRCKDCIYHPIVPENWNGSNYSLEWPVIERSLFKCPCHCPDDFYSWVPDDDWFCGNGKKRREQNDI